MKDFTEYSSIEEIVSDLIQEGLVTRNKKIKAAFASIGARCRRNYTDSLKTRILENIKNAQRPDRFGVMTRSKIYKMVRGDNHPQDFEAAMNQLLAENKIKEEKLWTDAPRPTLQYHLVEF
jgi:hypothetical protein